MMTSSRRLHDGSQALGLAFTVGRAQEALFRLRGGAPLGDADRKVFRGLAALFRDASRGLRWLEAAARRNGTDGISASQAELRAVEMVSPALTRDASEPAVMLETFSTVADQIAEGASDHPGLKTFADLLQRLATRAASSGSIARGAGIGRRSLTPLPKLT